MDLSSGIGASLPLPFVRFHLSISLLSLSVLPFHSLPVSASQLASSVLLFRSRFPDPSPSLRPGFPCLLSGSVYLAFCMFPFVLPCFAPTAVPQVLPFWISPPGSTLSCHFLSSASAVASHYSAFHSSFPLSSRLRLTAGFPGASVPLTLPRSFPFCPTRFPVPFLRFCVLSFLFVSFRPSQLRSHSCSTGASLSGFPSGINA